MNMGNSYGVPSLKFYGEISTDDSEETDDEEEPSRSTEEAAATGCISSPAHEAVTTFHKPDFVSVEQAQRFEQTLDLMETISLIFLTHDDLSYALQTMKVLINQGPKSFSKYYISELLMKKGPDNVSKKLLEGLAVIKNFRILKDLGVTKKEAEERFLPLIDCNLFLSRVKKMLYLMIENLGSELAEALVENVRNDGRELFKDDITTKVDSKYVEFYLLFWVDRGYISLDPLQLDNLFSVMTDSRKHVVPFELSPELKHRLNEVKNMANNITKENIVDQTHGEIVYPIIDEKNVGLVLIFNFDNFEEREQRKEYLNLLSPHDLGNRNGSPLDAERLQTIFTVLNFKVVIINNISHFEIQGKIEANVKEHYSSEHSMLFLCVLSHGGKGVIYGSNSCPVRISSISNMISGSSLVGRMFANKPKAIFVQACQGPGRLCVEPEGPEFEVRDTDYELDSCEGACLDSDGQNNFTPKRADVLICLAIIEGYAAIRHQKEGSFYIHELCRTIRRYKDYEHLEDMILRVHASLNDKRIHVQLPDIQRLAPCEKGHMDCAIMYMTPKKESTLRAKLYLTQQALQRAIKYSPLY